VAAASSIKSPILVSSAVVLESTNALELRVFRGQASRLDVGKALHNFEIDVQRGVLNAAPVPPAVWDTARNLSRTHSATLGTRSLDILQVAIAIVLRADTFLTFDRNQAALAQAEGLTCEIRES
jgi:predicted nucleic acid-binding protein